MTSGRKMCNACGEEGRKGGFCELPEEASVPRGKHLLIFTFFIFALPLCVSIHGIDWFLALAWFWENTHGRGRKGEVA